MCYGRKNHLIVTGDKQILRLKEFEKIRIVGLVGVLEIALTGTKIKFIAPPVYLLGQSHGMPCQLVGKGEDRSKKTRCKVERLTFTKCAIKIFELNRSLNVEDFCQAGFGRISHLFLNTNSFFKFYETLLF